MVSLPGNETSLIKNKAFAKSNGVFPVKNRTFPTEIETFPVVNEALLRRNAAFGVKEGAKAQRGRGAKGR